MYIFWIKRAQFRLTLRLTPNVTLGDVSRIYFGHYENTAAYYGNGKPAIALAVQRGRDADVIRTVARVEKALDHMRQKYPNLIFEITDTQKDLIVQSTENLNVYGFREKAAISHIMERFEKAFENTPLPPSVTMAHTGDMKQFAASARRMAVAVGFAVPLTFFTLVVLFNSVKVAGMLPVALGSAIGLERLAPFQGWCSRKMGIMQLLDDAAASGHESFQPWTLERNDHSSLSKADSPRRFLAK